MVLIQVKSETIANLITSEAYEALVKQMNASEFSNHEAYPVIVDESSNRAHMSIHDSKLLLKEIKNYKRKWNIFK